MRGLNFLAFFTVLCISCVAELSGQEIKDIYECICSGGSELQDEYKECREVKPKAIQAMVKTCRQELLLDSEDMATVWQNICYDIDNNLMEVFYCVMNSDIHLTLSSEEKENMSKFNACVKKIHDRHCTK